MTRTNAGEASAYTLLASLLPEPGPSRSRLQRWLPTSGTLHTVTDPWLSGSPLLAAVLVGARAFGQVILINNPLSGALLLLALVLQSGWLGLFAILGLAGAQGLAMALDWDPSTRLQGIHGFNGVLVGCAAATFADLRGPALVGWLLAVPLAGAASAALLESLRRGWFCLPSLPPLTLPFCLLSWLLLGLGLGLEPAGLALASPPPPAAVPATLPGLLEGIVHGFGQVFLCPGLPSGLLVVAAVAIASPLAALLGAAGGLAAALAALLLQAPWSEVVNGLASYNGVLVAIAIGGIFYAPSRLSLPIALAGAAGSVPLARLLQVPLNSLGLPLLTSPFVLATWLALLLVRQNLPALLPVAVHAILTPEEHRRRYRVALRMLGEFHRRLGTSTPASLTPDLAATAPPEDLERIGQLFRRLDRDGNGWLSIEELRAGLAAAGDGGHQQASELLNRIARGMDRNGDGRLDREEVVELVLRLQRLRQGRERLLTYLLPSDADGDGRLDRAELARLLRGIGLAPLQAYEEQVLFGPQGSALTWGEFVDRLLLS
ncbi:urea transporter [Cyanobium sp. ATX 6A2]|uniref:urea transporter n=1 Tax=Cyanobium sp. ATX 6A2 TaxID=2823700 RepID=UPI0020CDFE31|nr:urea transporter [Cyanobium sp. ATX 6A2]MCP9887351.1 urea transporter [Cyanobium sp. ATX 6A2]